MGFLLDHFRESLRKWGLVLDWRQSGTKVDSIPKCCINAVTIAKIKHWRLSSVLKRLILLEVQRAAGSK